MTERFIQEFKRTDCYWLIIIFVIIVKVIFWVFVILAGFILMCLMFGPKQIGDPNAEPRRLNYGSRPPMRDPFTGRYEDV